MVAGFSTRHVVQSAVQAGYEVFAVDHFCDADLRLLARGWISFDELDDLLPAIGDAVDTFSPDGIIPTSGAECLDLPAPLLGTPADVARRFLDKATTQVFFEELGLPVPARVSSGRYPAMLKPCSGSGGWRNRVVESDADIAAWVAEFPDVPFLLQELAEGIPASVCCVSDGTRAVAIAVNRQILRDEGAFRYGFAGSITPFIHQMTPEMIRIAEQVVAASGCRGIAGVDMLVRDGEISVIELNPRFVATLDTIERAYGVNLVRLHLDALSGILPETTPIAGRVVIRRILFADRPIIIEQDLGCHVPGARDIPVPPASFEPGEAVISLYGEGATEAEAAAMLDTSIIAVSQQVH